MKKIATKFVLVTASTFILGTAMAQTDTTKTPVPDTTETPTPTDTTSVPTDTTKISKTNIAATTSLANVVSKYNDTFYAVTNKELLSTKQYDLKTEEENEA
ncbi:hypothetical protein [Niabella hibiscisoli]|uniref:hypothetical protein n=1 Tax=Niabella hibiscisoli TaxID=1825928 RepID=UPI001F0DD0B8|nr:hypothetical protein [Niabella hibiscisoli]MCH5717652.1 hypothetical protein [Niabella hibiscisoli]